MTAILSDTSEPAIARAAASLRAGDLVAFPTETVYGLGADATNDHAVAKVFAAKNRPEFNPLIVHVPDVATAAALAELDGVLKAVADAFWAGPLTLVAAKRPNTGLSELATAGLDTVALRVPSEPVAHRLLTEAGVPVVAPSANRSGHVSATTAHHVADDLGDAVALIVDAGPSRIGLESTIVAAPPGEPWSVTILRAGAITADDIARATNAKVNVRRHAIDETAPTAPGQLSSHYAPRARVRLDAKTAAGDEALLGFGRVAPVGPGTPFRNLSEAGDLAEAAANLFRFLRELDDDLTGRADAAIAVSPIPDEGLGVAINDRLRRAAAPR